MHDLTTFEQLFADRLERETARALPAFDAERIAAAAMVRRNPWDRVLNALHAGVALPPQPMRRVALVGVAALLVLALVALAVGMQRLGGQRLAYVRAEPGDVVISNADGSDPRVIGHSELSPLRNVVSWAPGGGHLATFGEGWDLAILDVSGNVTFTRKLEDRGSRWAWSPDGRHLAVLDGAWSRNDGPSGPVVDPHLFIVSAEGAIEASTDLPADYRYAIGQGGIAWSPDGAQLAIAGFDVHATPSATASSIWIVDRATLGAREIVSPDRTYDVDPAWLPDGRILFSRLNDGIWQVDPATEAASQVFVPQCPCSGRTLVPFVPSPDGRRLAVVGPNLGLAVLDLRSGAVTALALPDGVGGNPPVGWTADGAALTIMVGPIVDHEPFYADEFGILDIASGKLDIIATGVVAFDAVGT